MDDLNVYSGKLNYKDIYFDFVYDKQELRLIPPDDKKSEVWHWKIQEISNGVYTKSDQLVMDSAFLEGVINETGQKIVFIMRQGSYIGSCNSVLLVEVIAVILFNSEKKLINRISVSGPEINAIHSVGKAFSLIYNEEQSKKGIISIKTNEFDSTTTEKSKFVVDNKEIFVHFGIGRRVSTGIQETPLKLSSTMIFEFVPTDEYEFIFLLYNIAKSFIQYLCYRRNIVFDSVELSELLDNGKQYTCARMQVLESSQQCESKVIKDGRYIKQQYIAGCEGKILSDIAADNIYMRHLPDSYEKGRYIDASRFVMITAAFEWEFRRIFPDGVKKKEAKVKAEEQAKSALQELINNSSGELKNIYKYMQKNIGSNPLSGKIAFLGKDISDVIDIFGKHLYHLNGEELEYSKMGERLSMQRNNFAHGNLDKEFLGVAFLDLIFLELVLYAMQLKYYGIEDIKIKKAINELFHKNIMINEE